MGWFLYEENICMEKINKIHPPLLIVITIMVATISVFNNIYQFYLQYKDFFSRWLINSNWSTPTKVYWLIFYCALFDVINVFGKKILHFLVSVCKSQLTIYLKTNYITVSWNMQYSRLLKTEKFLSLIKYCFYT